MSLIAASGTQALPSPYFDFAQAVTLRRMALNLSDQPAYLLAPEIILLLDNIASLHRLMLFDFLWNTGARINEALAVTSKNIVLDTVKPFVVLRTLKQRNQTTGRRGRPGKDTQVKRTLPLLCTPAARSSGQVDPLCYQITDDTAREALDHAHFSIE